MAIAPPRGRGAKFLRKEVSSLNGCKTLNIASKQLEEMRKQIKNAADQKKSSKK